MFGEEHKNERGSKIAFCVFIAAVSSLNAVLDFCDAAFFAMAIFNIIGLYFLIPIVKAEQKSNIARLGSGEVKRFY